MNYMYNQIRRSLWYREIVMNFHRYRFLWTICGIFFIALIPFYFIFNPSFVPPELTNCYQQEAICDIADKQSVYSTNIKIDEINFTFRCNPKINTVKIEALESHSSSLSAPISPRIQYNYCRLHHNKRGGNILYNGVLMITIFANEEHKSTRTYTWKQYLSFINNKESYPYCNVIIADTFNFFDENSYLLSKKGPDSFSSTYFSNRYFIDNTESRVDHIMNSLLKIAGRSKSFYVVRKIYPTSTATSTNSASTLRFSNFTHYIWNQLTTRYGHILEASIDNFGNPYPLEVAMFSPLTAILAAYDPNRGINLEKILEKLSTNSLFREVIVIWNGPKESKPVFSNSSFTITSTTTSNAGSVETSISFPKQRPIIRVLQMTRNTLVNRWRDDLNVSTAAVVVMDDDILVQDSRLFWRMQSVWLRQPKSLVSLFARNYVYRPVADVVLPRVIMLHKKYLDLYSSLGRGPSSFLFNYVDEQLGHCDDILLNVLSGVARAPMNYILKPGDSTVELPFFKSLSRQKNRTAVRRECQLYFEMSLRVQPPYVCSTGL